MRLLTETPTHHPKNPVNSENSNHPTQEPGAIQSPVASRSTAAMTAALWPRSRWRRPRGPEKAHCWRHARHHSTCSRHLLRAAVATQPAMSRQHARALAPLLLLAAGQQHGARGFVFTPTDPNNGLFDTWLFVQPPNLTTGPVVPAFYFNYLSACKAASCGVEPFPVVKAGGAPWNGVGGATSPDGVHFSDQGVLFRKDPRAGWLGSGSVLRNVAGEYVMNFSEDYDCGSPSCQSIFFATSKDLRNWTRVPFAAPPANDSNVFKYNDGGLEGKTPGYERNGRWDCIATVPKPGSPGHFIGYYLWDISNATESWIG
jgi:hypothetical protein